MGSSVLAIVLTHNAPEALTRCLAAVAAQTVAPAEILVVDNASTPPAHPSAPVTLQRRECNDGPGGGHAAGLATFLASAHDSAWVMDDDCVPTPGCLEALLARQAGLTGLAPVFPAWIEGAEGPSRFLPAWCGLLVSRELVRRIGLPRADYVWWAEDTEYLQARVLNAGLQPVQALDAVVHHHRVRGRPQKPAWKVYYEVRNTIVYRLYVQQWTRNHARLLARSLGGLAVQAARRGPGRRARVVAYARGLVDGVGNRLGLRMPLG